MSKALKVGLLIVASMLCGVLASSASASEWHTNGPLTATSTNGTTWRLDDGTSPVIIECQTDRLHLFFGGAY